MDITSFTLGILSVAFTFNLVGAVFNLVMVYKLKREINEFNQMISDTTNWTSNKFDSTYDKIDTVIRDIMRTLDSRFDKMTNRIDRLEREHLGKTYMTDNTNKIQKELLND
jgi:hypothetical protein